MCGDAIPKHSRVLYIYFSLSFLYKIRLQTDNCTAAPDRQFCEYTQELQS